LTAPLEGLRDIGNSILVYSRGGRRGKKTLEKLVKLGYTNVYEFGGINNWTGDVE